MNKQNQKGLPLIFIQCYKPFIFILKIAFAIPFGWILGQLIGKGIMEVLIVLNLDDNLFRFMDAISLF